MINVVVDFSDFPPPENELSFIFIDERDDVIRIKKIVTYPFFLSFLSIPESKKKKDKSFIQKKVVVKKLTVVNV